ncbi:MAG: hypothetical protein RI883_383 [Bacteroidota bacterium]|jgi:hypothetical protein
MKTLILLMLCSVVSHISFDSFCQEGLNGNSKQTMIDVSKKANIKCITPPMGFDTLTGFNGYYHKELGSSIVVSLVDGKTVKDAETAFSAEHIANIKSNLLSKTYYTLEDGKQMLVYHLTYEFKDETWGRFQAFVGDENSTLWFVISYPYKYSQDIEGILLKSLRSVNFDQK